MKDPLVERCEDWFLRKGLTQFVQDYARRRAVDQATPGLIIIVSFALASDPWVPLIADRNVPGIAVLILAGIWLTGPLRWVLEHPEHERRWRRSLPVRVLMLVPLLIGFHRTRLLELAPSIWSDLAVMTVLLTVSCRLRRLSWLEGVRHRRAVHRATAVLAFSAVVLCLPLNDLYGSLLPTWLYPSLCALPVALLLLLSSTVAVRRAQDGEEPGELPERSMLRAVSWTAVLLAVEIVVLPYAVPDNATLVSVAGLLLCVGGLVHALVPPPVGRPAPRSGTRGDGPPMSWIQHVRGENLSIVKAVAAVGSAVLVHLVVVHQVAPEEFESRIVADVVLVVVGVLLVALGTDRLGCWAIEETCQRWSTIVVELISRIPALLIFLAFLGINEELWRIAAAQPPLRFIGMAAVLLVPAVLYLVLESQRVIAESERAMSSWHRVRNELPDRVREVFRPGPAPPDPRLGVMRRGNLVAAALAYHALVLLPTGLVVWALFLWLGHAVVTADLFIEGDEGRRADELWRTFEFYDQPWTEVAFVLAALAVLWLGIRLTRPNTVGDTAVDDNVAALVSRYLRRCVAVALVHDAALAQARRNAAPADPPDGGTADPAPVPAASGPERDGR